jgi:hypothetical protein
MAVAVVRRVFVDFNITTPWGSVCRDQFSRNAGSTGVSNVTTPEALTHVNGM